jgi:hypothetical protein
MPDYWTTSAANDAAWGVVEHTTGDHSISETTDAVTGQVVSATVRCAWLSRDNVIADILYNSLLYPRNPNGGARAKTAACIAAPGKYTLQGSLHQPEEALITISYEQPVNREYDPVTQELFAESLEPNAEFITLDYRKFRWTSTTGKKLTAEQAPGKLIVGLDFVQTRFNLVTLPSAILRPNRVNQNSITARLLGLTFPPETLLYVNSQPARTITSAGATKWTMTSRFSYREDGWNKFWREDKEGGPGWDQIFVAKTEGGDANTPYKNFTPADLSSILI